MKPIGELIKEDLNAKKEAYPGLQDNFVVTVQMFIVSFKKVVLIPALLFEFR